MKENIYIHIYIYVCIIEFLCCTAETNIKSATRQFKRKVAELGCVGLAQELYKAVRELSFLNCFAKASLSEHRHEWLSSSWLPHGCQSAAPPPVSHPYSRRKKKEVTGKTKGQYQESKNFPKNPQLTSTKTMSHGPLLTAKEAKEVLSVRFSRSVVSDSLQTHGLQRARLPCPSSVPRIYSSSCPSSL